MSAPSKLARLARPSVSAVLKLYGEEYIQRFGHLMTAQQKKVLRAVMACREDSLGTIRYRCASCGEEQTVPRSCCNRHCPACQGERTGGWLARQSERLLPCHYFLVTFTVPQEVRGAMLANPVDGLHYRRLRRTLPLWCTRRVIKRCFAAAVLTVIGPPD